MTDVNSRILKYLRSDRRGKEANALEREALNDAFLYEALEGLAEQQREQSIRDIEFLSRCLKVRINTRWKRKLVWMGTAAVILVFFVVGLGIYRWCGTQPYKEESFVYVDENKEVAEVVFEHEGLQDSLSIQKSQVTEEVDIVPESADEEWESLMKENKGSVPFGGYKQFYRYIQDSLRYPEDALQQRREGNIKLSFYVNKAGRPSHIRVVKWITYSCNKEAIRLLCEGPAWNYTGDTSFVLIPFRLQK
ncbi:energy transducer TonB [Odoribacter lunatus]|uniref:energy transducer TonB n=1 Tax=Odoribacter lunatus TaxID=2941335 RepID=UPI00203D0C3A|nr:energy transducer TonB [Odoribacter lunatus]